MYPRRLHVTLNLSPPPEGFSGYSLHSAETDGEVLVTCLPLSCYHLDGRNRIGARAERVREKLYAILGNTYDLPYGHPPSERERERERQTSKGRYPRSLRLWGTIPQESALGPRKDGQLMQTKERWGRGGREAKGNQARVAGARRKRWAVTRNVAGREASLR